MEGVFVFLYRTFTVFLRFSFVVEPRQLRLLVLNCSHYLLFMVLTWFPCGSSTVLLLYWLWQCALLCFWPDSMKPFQGHKINLFIWRFLHFRLIEIDIKPAAQYFFFHFYPRLHIATWNVATAEPPEDVSSLLRLNSPKRADLYIIGYRKF